MYLEKTCPRATLFTTNSIWPDVGSNPGRRGGKPATNRLSYGTALKHDDIEISKVDVYRMSVGIDPSMQVPLQEFNSRQG
jgi:hypothetical protein